MAVRKAAKRPAPNRTKLDLAAIEICSAVYGFERCVCDTASTPDTCFAMKQAARFALGKVLGERLPEFIGED